MLIPRLLSYSATYLARLTGRWLPDVLWRVPTSTRTAYLTFDDGPSVRGTPALLDLLARYDARATFFLLGRHAEERPELVKRLIAAGHTIGNHTHNHPDAWRTPADDVRASLVRAGEALQRISNTDLSFMRPPYGRFTRAMRDWCTGVRQRMVLWDVMPGDFYPGASSEFIERFVVRFTRPGSVIVLHDNPKFLDVTLPALEGILRRLSADGWRFEALSAAPAEK
ncbi:MAG: polysaccharide deacetylase family protein [Bacteroidota bacterium]